MRLALTVALLAVASSGAIAVVAGAQTATNGLPAYTDGYAKWAKLNRKPSTKPGAHNGVKNIYASKKRVGKLFPNGTVIVKSIAEPGAKGLPGHVAVMRKVQGRWQWVEYELTGSRYGVLAKGQVCTGCHVQARSTDWVFTRG